MNACEITVPGKWVLAGEHAVLRGAMAIALPHPEYCLSLLYTPDATAPSLEIRPSEQGELFRRLLAEIPGAGALMERPRGTLEISSTIPLGAGLGSSAAISVALARLASRLGALPEDAVRETAIRLEDYFHGESSGMDVAVISVGRPVLFRRGQAPVPIEVKALPRFTFHDTGIRASTRVCIEAVEALRARDPEAARNADTEMIRAADEALSGLTEYGRGDREAGLEHLRRAFELGQHAFDVWGLLPREAREIAESLRSQGALAVKLTGAGGGGFLVALWP